MACTRCTDAHGKPALIRPYHHAQFPVELLRDCKRETVTVVLPACPSLRAVIVAVPGATPRTRPLALTVAMPAY